MRRAFRIARNVCAVFGVVGAAATAFVVVESSREGIDILETDRVDADASALRCCVDGIYRGCDYMGCGAKDERGKCRHGVEVEPNAAALNARDMPFSPFVRGSMMITVRTGESYAEFVTRAKSHNLAPMPYTEWRAVYLSGRRDIEIPT